MVQYREVFAQKLKNHFYSCADRFLILAMIKHSSKKTIFTRLFPVPKFLEMPSAGLAISDSSIRFVGFKNSRKGPSLETFGKKDLPAGVVDRGYIHDQEKLVEKLREIKEEHDLEFVKVVLPEDKVYLFKITIPWVERGEIRSALEFKIEENAPVKASEAVFDFVVLEESKSDNKLSLVVSVSSIKTIEAYIQALKEVRLTPVSLGIEPQATCRSVVEIGDDLTHLVLNIDNSKVGMFIMSEEVVHFTSSFHFSVESGGVGGSGSDPAVSQNFYVNPIKKTKTQADDFSEKEKDLPEDQTSGAPDKSVDWSSRPLVLRLREEVNRVIEYWQTHNTEGVSDDQKRVRKIILTGDVSDLKGLVSYLNNADFWEAEVILGNVWVNVFSLDKSVPPILFDQSLSFASAIGTALPSSSSGGAFSETLDSRK